MSILSELRVNIAEQLATDTSQTVIPYVPARIVPPVYLVNSGSPYVESGDTYGSFKVRMNVEVISATAANDTTTDALDALIEDAVVSLVNMGAGIENVQQPYQLDTGNAQYLATSITINKTINF